MLGLIKALPIVILLAGAGYSAHKWIVTRLEDQITQQQMQIEQYVAQNVALQTAAQQNEETIRSLEANAKRQVEQISTLTTQSAEYQKQANEAMKIFQNHNFTKLARLRPDTIERQANEATRAVFDSVEQDSREIADLEEVERNDD